MPVYPGEESPTLIVDKTIKNDGYNGMRLESNMHSGTHIDAPMHVRNIDLTIDKFDVGLFTGKACLIDVSGQNPVRFQPGWGQKFRDHEIVLFRTYHNRTWNTPGYFGGYPDFEALIAEKLVENGVRITGFDSPSPDRMPYNFHMAFLQGERFMLESLTNLKELPVDRSFRLFAFPLKVQAEASLLRVVAELE
jgi:kynurenine formamidase